MPRCPYIAECGLHRNVTMKEALGVWNSFYCDGCYSRCERFKLLADAVQDDKELAKLYRGLWASEHGHYRTFIQLAEQIQPEKLVAKRWDEMLDAEAKLIARQAPGPRMHRGVGE